MAKRRPKGAHVGLTDKRIIEAFHRLQSPILVAQELDCSVPNLWQHRKRLERQGIILPVRDNRPKYNTAAIDHSKAIATIRISDGHILVASDLHIWPIERPTMQRAFLKFVKMMKPMAIVLNGDVLDGSKISRWPTIGWEKKPEIKEELDACIDYLTDLAAAAPKAKRFWPAGNHDTRFESWIANKAPEFAKVKGVHLKDHFEHWTPCWRIDVNDDLVIRHRELGGEHADYRNVVMSGKNIVTGHDHRLGVVLYHNYAGLKYGVRSGYMCESPTDPQFVHYLEGKMPCWYPGFVVLTFKDGQLLMPELCIKDNKRDDHVQWRGELLRV